MPDQTTEASHADSTHPSMAVLSLAALGVVFGDIGTSPLYTLKTVLDVTGGAASEPAAILGPLSLILWTLIIVTSLKYVTFALRVDNNGEGGILALLALLRRTLGRRQPLIVLIALCGAALVYGDAAITPAISGMACPRPFRLHGTAGYPSPAAAPSSEGLPGGFLQRNLFYRARDGRATRGWQGAAAPGAEHIRIPVAQFERGGRVFSPTEGYGC